MEADDKWLEYFCASGWVAGEDIKYFVQHYDVREPFRCGNNLYFASRSCLATLAAAGSMAKLQLIHKREFERMSCHPCSFPYIYVQPPI